MIGVPIAVGYGLWRVDSEVIEKVVYTRVNTTDVSR